MRLAVPLTLLTLALRGAASAEETPPSVAQHSDQANAPGTVKPGGSGSDSAPEVEAPVLKVGVGILKLVAVPGVRRVTVGDPSVLLADVPGDGLIRLVGVASGRTTLVAWKSDSTKESFVVSAIHDHGLGNPLVRDVWALLGEMEGVVVRQIGDRIFIDGTTRTPAAAERIAQVVASYPGLVDLTKPASEAPTTLTRVNQALAKAGFRGFTVNLIGRTYFLEGLIESEEDRARAEAIVKAVLAAPE